MRRRSLALSATAVAAFAVLAASVPSFAVAPAPRVVSQVTGTTSTSFRLAVSPTAPTAYIADTTDTLKVFSTTTNAVTGQSPSFVTNAWGPQRDVATDGTKVYVAASTVAPGTSNLVVLNLDATLDYAVGASPRVLSSIAPAPGGESVMAVGLDGAAPALLRFDLAVSPRSFSAVAFPASVPAPQSLFGVAVGPGGEAYAVGATASAEAVLYLFDDVFGTGARSVILPGASSTAAVAVSPDGSQVVVTSPVQQTVYLVDVATLAIEATISTPYAGPDAQYSPDGSTVYLAGDGGVGLVDVDTGSIAGEVAMPGTALSSAVVSPTGARLWVADANPGQPVRMLSDSAVATTPGTATVGVAFAMTFAATGFDLPVTWTISPALPSGLTLDAASGAVSGTPGAALAATTFEVAATSADGDATTSTWSLEVAAAPAPTASPGPTVSSSPGSPALPATGLPDRLPATGAPFGYAALALGGTAMLLGSAALFLSRRGRAVRFRSARLRD